MSLTVAEVKGLSHEQYAAVHPGGALGRSLMRVEEVMRVDENCPQFVQNGCGCDACCGHCADCLETVTPLIEWISDLIWICGSPLAFPIIFCFDPETTATGGWKISMLESPTRRPMGRVHDGSDSAS